MPMLTELQLLRARQRPGATPPIFEPQVEAPDFTALLYDAVRQNNIAAALVDMGTSLAGGLVYSEEELKTRVIPRSYPRTRGEAIRQMDVRFIPWEEKNLEGTIFQGRPELWHYIAYTSNMEQILELDEEVRHELEADQFFARAPGWQGMMAHLAAASSSPEAWIGLSPLVLGKMTPLMRGVAVGWTNAATAWGAEEVLQLNQPTRMPEERLMAVGSAAALGMSLGWMSGILHQRTRARLEADYRRVLQGEGLEGQLHPTTGQYRIEEREIGVPPVPPEDEARQTLETAVKESRRNLWARAQERVSGAWQRFQKAVDEAEAQARKVDEDEIEAFTQDAGPVYVRPPEEGPPGAAGTGPLIPMPPGEGDLLTRLARAASQDIEQLAGQDRMRLEIDYPLGEIDRMSPAQRAELVALMREELGVVTDAWNRLEARAADEENAFEEWLSQGIDVRGERFARAETMTQEAIARARAERITTAGAAYENTSQVLNARMEALANQIAEVEQAVTTRRAPGDEELIGRELTRVRQELERLPRPLRQPSEGELRQTGMDLEVGGERPVTPARPVEAPRPAERPAAAPEIRQPTAPTTLDDMMIQAAGVRGVETPEATGDLSQWPVRNWIQRARGLGPQTESSLAKRGIEDLAALRRAILVRDLSPTNVPRGTWEKLYAGAFTNAEREVLDRVMLDLAKESGPRLAAIERIAQRKPEAVRALIEADPNASGGMAVRAANDQKIDALIDQERQRLDTAHTKQVVETEAAKVRVDQAEAAHAQSLGRTNEAEAELALIDAEQARDRALAQRNRLADELTLFDQEQADRTARKVLIGRTQLSALRQEGFDPRSVLVEQMLEEGRAAREAEKAAGEEAAAAFKQEDADFRRWERETGGALGERPQDPRRQAIAPRGWQPATSSQFDAVFSDVRRLRGLRVRVTESPGPTGAEFHGGFLPSPSNAWGAATVLSATRGGRVEVALEAPITSPELHSIQRRIVRGKAYHRQLVEQNANPQAIARADQRLRQLYDEGMREVRRLRYRPANRILQLPRERLTVGVDARGEPVYNPSVTRAGEGPRVASAQRMTPESRTRLEQRVGELETEAEALRDRIRELGDPAELDPQSAEAREFARLRSELTQREGTIAGMRSEIAGGELSADPRVRKLQESLRGAPSAPMERTTGIRRGLSPSEAEGEIAESTLYAVPSGQQTANLVAGFAETPGDRFDINIGEQQPAIKSIKTDPETGRVVIEYEDRVWTLNSLEAERERLLRAIQTVSQKGGRSAAGKRAWLRQQLAAIETKIQRELELSDRADVRVLDDPILGLREQRITRPIRRGSASRPASQSARSVEGRYNQPDTMRLTARDIEEAIGIGERIESLATAIRGQVLAPELANEEAKAIVGMVAKQHPVGGARLHGFSNAEKVELLDRIADRILERTTETELEAPVRAALASGDMEAALKGWRSQRLRNMVEEGRPVNEIVEELERIDDEIARVALGGEMAFEEGGFGGRAISSRDLDELAVDTGEPGGRIQRLSKEITDELVDENDFDRLQGEAEQGPPDVPEDGEDGGGIIAGGATGGNLRQPQPQGQAPYHLHVLIDRDPATLDRSARMNKLQNIFGIDADSLRRMLRWAPKLRGITSPNANVVKMWQKLTDVGLWFEKNRAGIGNEPSVEDLAHLDNGTLIELMEEIPRQFARYWRRVSGRQVTGTETVLSAQTARIQQRIARIRGRLTDSLHYRAFLNEVGKAMIRGGEHEVPEVAAMARLIRSKVYDPALEKMIELRMLRSGLRQSLARGYLTRLYLNNEMRARRTEFLEMATEWFRRPRTDEMGNVSTPTEQWAKDMAVEVYDQILGTVDGRIPYERIQGRGTRAARERVFDIPDEILIEHGFLDTDIETQLKFFFRSVVPDIRLAELEWKMTSQAQTSNENWRPDPSLSRVIDAIRRDYSRQIDRATGEQKRLLETHMEADIRDLEAAVSELRGTLGAPANPNSPIIRAGAAMRRFNVLADMGTFALSSLPDAGRPIMMFGVGNFFKHFIVPMVRDWQTFKMNAREVKSFGTAGDVALNTRAASLFDTGDLYGRHTSVEQALRLGADYMALLSLLSPWNAMMKQWVGAGIADMAAKDVLQVAAELGGTQAPSEAAQRLAKSGIGFDMVPRVARELRRRIDAGHVTESGLIEISTKDWVDKEAAQAWAIAIRRDVDRAIVTPGVGEKPIWMSGEAGRFFTQYKTFAVASATRTLLLGGQRADRAFWNGAAIMTSLGMASIYLKSQAAGWPTPSIKDDYWWWIRNGIDRSGLFGFLSDANNVVGIATRGGISAGRLLGGKPDPGFRYTNRNLLTELVGPSSQTILDVGEVAGGVGDLFRGYTPPIKAFNAARRLTPGNNLFYLSRVYDRAFRKARRLGIDLFNTEPPIPARERGGRRVARADALLQETQP